MLDFIFGLTLPARALRLVLKQRTLFLLSVVPLLISILVYWLFYQRVFGEAQSWLVAKSLGVSEAVFGSTSWLASVSKHAVLLSTEIIFWLTAGFLLAPLINLAALPFNDFLAEQAEGFSKPELPSVGKQSWSGLMRQFLLDLLKNLLCALALFICFVMAWIPVLNIFSHFFGWLLISFQYLSYPQTRRDWGVLKSFAYLLRPRVIPGALGFGIALSFLFAVPLLGIFLSPLAVVGGTLLFAKQSQAIK